MSPAPPLPSPAACPSCRLEGSVRRQDGGGLFPSLPVGQGQCPCGLDQGLARGGIGDSGEGLDEAHHSFPGEMDGRMPPCTAEQPLDRAVAQRRPDRQPVGAESVLPPLVLQHLLRADAERHAHLRQGSPGIKPRLLQPLMDWRDRGQGCVDLPAIGQRGRRHGGNARHGADLP